jgi:hypothetical protein
MSAGLALALTAAPVAFAGDYPPNSDAEGSVEPSRIHAGQCATFSGKGFSPDVTIDVTDNGESRGTATANHAGKFSKRLCYPADTPAGEHVLRGTGDAPDSTTSARRGSFFRMSAAEAAVRRTVTAVLYVDGVQQSQAAQSDSNVGILEQRPGAVQPGSGRVAAPVEAILPRADAVVPGSPATSGAGGLAFTGFQAIIGVALGTVLIAVGSLVLVLAEQRHRRRRRLA